MEHKRGVRPFGLEPSLFVGLLLGEPPSRPRVDGYVPFTTGSGDRTIRGINDLEGERAGRWYGSFVNVVCDLGGRIDRRDGQRLRVFLLRAA